MRSVIFSRLMTNNSRRSNKLNYFHFGGEHPDALHPAGSGAGSDPAATWKDLEWIKAASRLPVVAKGVMTGVDVELCAEVGADVVKAIALGAKAVFIGRPLFWGLAVGGELGVVHVLNLRREEIEITTAKCGRTISRVDSSAIAKAPPI
jgi:isopentenyl diphosphate isomerase/L-lactate dehydrogenase-like FMN-dependent dehydrogenase